MIDFMFSFRGRIGRLRYFLSSLALSAWLVLGGMITVGIAGVVRGGRPQLAPLLLAALIVIAAFLTFLYSSFSIQARRIRDIGWNPVFVISAVIGVGVIDRLIARAAPGLSTGVLLAGLVFNMGFGLALLFWPGAGDSDSPGAANPRADRPAPPRASAPVQAARAPAPAQRPTGARTTFGLRGT